MGYPFPSKKISLRLFTNPRIGLGGKWGFKPETPVASPVAAVAPDDAVEGLKNAAVDCVSWGGGRRLVIVNFSASTATNETWTDSTNSPSK
jgi:hypothetical protein